MTLFKKNLRFLQPHEHCIIPYLYQLGNRLIGNGHRKYPFLTIESFPIGGSGKIEVLDNASDFPVLRLHRLVTGHDFKNYVPLMYNHIMLMRQRCY